MTRIQKVLALVSHYRVGVEQARVLAILQLYVEMTSLGVAHELDITSNNASRVLEKLTEKGLLVPGEPYTPRSPRGGHVTLKTWRLAPEVRNDMDSLENLNRLPNRLMK